MNVLYEENNAFKVGSVLQDEGTALMVEAPHGKRSKIKSNSVLLKFDRILPNDLMNQAESAASELEADFLWECCGEEEFSFLDLARDYFGHDPSPIESTSLLFKLHSAPKHFYKKGKGKFKAATREALQAAVASDEKKRIVAEQISNYVAELTAFHLPEPFKPIVNTLLYKPDKNSIEHKALEQACTATRLTVPKLLEKCGAIASAREYHLNGFLFEYFPKGRDFGEIENLACAGLRDVVLPRSETQAFSIDDQSTTEIDDAFSVSPLPHGRWRVGVHIAAPALGIEAGSVLDTIARQRISTVYMPGDKITMLPQAAVDRYSLNIGKDLPAISLYLELDTHYSVISSETRLENIEIAANLRHETLEQSFNEDTLQNTEIDYPFNRELAVLWQLANKLEQGRGKTDSKSQFQDYAFFVQDDRVEISERKRGTPIDKVVSELMIYANALWAKQLCEHQYMALYRCQENGKVKTTTEPSAHAGLGVTHYAWLTSPLRRYTDLINQRQLIALLRGEASVYPTAEPLAQIQQRFQLIYDAYSNFQRTMERYWSLRYLLQENITEAATTLFRENLVKFDNLPLIGRVPTVKDMAIGSSLQVEISRIDLFELALECRPKI